MDTLDCIKSRRSRRLFLDKDVSDSQIKQILECAITAPTSMDCQPWHFVIVRDKLLKNQIANLRDEDNRQQFLTAPVIVVVGVDLEKSPHRNIEDGVTATQNILLAVHDIGLGSVYMCGSKPTDEKVARKVREILDIPEQFIPVTILPIGYPDENEKLENKQLVNLDSVLHKDKW